MIAEPKPPSGLSAEASWHRQLLRWIKGWFVLSIEDYRVTETTNGRVFKKISGQSAKTPPFTQEKGMFPFRIYKPNPLPPDGFAYVVTFDEDGNAIPAKIDSTNPTDFTASPPTINPTTDAWRFWNVRTGLVEVRPWFNYIGYFEGGSELEMESNYSWLYQVWSGTDNIYPNMSTSGFDDPTTVAEPWNGRTLVVPGTPVSAGEGGEGIGFSIWAQVTPDISADDFLSVKIMGRTYYDAEIVGSTGIFWENELPYFPDSSPFVIPIGLISVGGYGGAPISSVSDWPVTQLTFNHVINRWPAAMFGAGGTAIDPITGLPITIPGGIGGIGALSYRGDWDNDDIQDMVFYPGDVIKKNSTLTFPDKNNVTRYFTGYNLYMSSAICFTDDPSSDGSFTRISGATLT